MSSLKAVAASSNSGILSGSSATTGMASIEPIVATPPQATASGAHSATRMRNARSAMSLPPRADPARAKWHFSRRSGRGEGMARAGDVGGGLYLGIDVGATKTHVALGRADGSVLA